MDKAAERETHDFMNVESFSQLPFIRPQPPTAKERPGGIKVFGIEFGNTDTNANDNPENLDNSTTAIDEPSNNNKDSDTNADSGRRFECHYCCRNFPTSQALGGHQNAHKRERQHAKRAHLQSAMVHSGLSDPTHVYGFMNYHRLGSSATYPSWNNTNHNNPTISTNSTTTHHNYSTTSNNRFYGSHHHGISSYSQQPINGSPLAFWRIPPIHHHNNPSSTTSAATTTSSFNRDHQLSSSTHHHSLPLFAGGGDIDLKPSSAGNNLSTTSNSSHSRYVYEVKPSMQDHVSLDLHL